MEVELQKITDNIRCLMQEIDRQRNKLNKLASMRREKMTHNEKQLNECLFACKTYLRFAASKSEAARIGFNQSKQ